MNRGKAMGEDGLSFDLIKDIGDFFLDKLAVLFTKCFYYVWSLCFQCKMIMLERERVREILIYGAYPSFHRFLRLPVLVGLLRSLAAPTTPRRHILSCVSFVVCLHVNLRNPFSPSLGRKF